MISGIFGTLAKTDILYGRHFLSVEPGLGRIIRHRHDFGAILFLDTRFSLPSTSKYLPSWVKRSHQSFDSPKKLAGLLRGFFNKMKAMQRRGTLQSAKPVVTGRGGIFTTTNGSPMKKQDIDMLKSMSRCTFQPSAAHKMSNSKWTFLKPRMHWITIIYDLRTGWS